MTKIKQRNKRDQQTRSPLQGLNTSSYQTSGETDQKRKGTMNNFRKEKKIMLQKQQRTKTETALPTNVRLR